MSANYSMIDSKLCQYLYLDVTPFQYDIPYCMGVEGSGMTKSIMAILGWVELEIGVPTLGLATIRLWVADTMSSKGTPFILGSGQIKKIFFQASTEATHNWPQPWRSIHYRYSRPDYWCEEDSEDDLFDSDDYNSDDSFDVLCQFESMVTPSTSHSSLDSWLRDIEYPPPHEEINESSKVEPVVTGISDVKTVSDVNGNPTPATQEEPALPQCAEQFQPQGGGESIVFTNLAVKSEGNVAEAELSACELKVPAPSTTSVEKLPPYPSVSCRITPTGETVFNLQWR